MTVQFVISADLPGAGQRLPALQSHNSEALNNCPVLASRQQGIQSLGSLGNPT
jgi:hypothetical protein